MSESELKGPIKGARFIHRAILSESKDFSDAAILLGIDDIDGATALGERLVKFEEILKMHEDSEDLAIFPALQARFPYIAETYEFDHHRHRHHSAALAATLLELGSGATRRRPELARVLAEQSVAFNAFMNLHIAKEDELLFPTYDQIFSPEEQVVHGQATAGHVSAEAMAAAGVWAFQRLDPDYREGFLRQLMEMMPAEAFAGLSKGLSVAVPASDWQEVVRRIPDLAAAPAATT